MDIVQYTEKIKDLCEKNNVKIKDLLTACKINKGALNDIDRKKSYPSIDKVVRIADYLNVSIDYLAGRSDTPTMTMPPAGIDTSTADGAALIAIYNRLSPVDRAKVLLYADNLSRSNGNDGNDGNGSKDGGI